MKDTLGFYIFKSFGFLNFWILNFFLPAWMRGSHFMKKGFNYDTPLSFFVLFNLITFVLFIHTQRDKKYFNIFVNDISTFVWHVAKFKFFFVSPPPSRVMKNKVQIDSKVTKRGVDPLSFTEIFVNRYFFLIVLFPYMQRVSLNHCRNIILELFS